MMEFGLTRTQFGQTILTACFITDLASVIALELIFAPFTLNSLIFATAAPAAFIFLLSAKTTTKIVSIYPVTRYFGSPHNDAIYTTLLLSTGLTFGTIASLFGLSQGIIDKSQYSALVAAIIGTAVIPTI